MNHGQMAQMCYTFICKANIAGSDAEAVVECKQWLQAIGTGQFQLTDRADMEPPPVVDPSQPAVPVGNGEDAPPDGPEGDAAPG